MYVALSKHYSRTRCSICVSMKWMYLNVGDSRRIYSGWQAAECQNHIADSVNKNFAVHSVTGKTNIEVTEKQVMGKRWFILMAIFR